MHTKHTLKGSDRRGEILEFKKLVLSLNSFVDFFMAVQFLTFFYQHIFFYLICGFVK